MLKGPEKISKIVLLFLAISPGIVPINGCNEEKATAIKIIPIIKTIIWPGIIKKIKPLMLIATEIL